jgi:hypothetical protein
MRPPPVGMATFEFIFKAAHSRTKVRGALRRFCLAIAAGETAEFDPQKAGLKKKS